MKLVFFFVSAFLTTTMTTATAKRWRTTTTPAYYHTTTAGPGGNLKGKMFTLSQDAGVTFFPPNYSQDPSTETTSTTTKPQPTTTKPNTTTTKPTTTTTKPTTTTTKPTTTKSTTTTWHTPTTPPVTVGLSVCLRFLADSSSIKLLTLAPYSNKALSLSVSNQWYTLSWSSYYESYQVSLNPMIPLWSSVQIQPWTSVCVVADFLKNVVQVFQGGSMSIRKIPRARMVWSGQRLLTVSGFDGQMTDLEVWDFPLKKTEIFRFMQNYGSSGTVLTWSNIGYKSNGNVLMEDTYGLGQGQPISSSEGEEQPIRSGRGRDQRHRHKKKFNERRRRKRQML